ncbi:MAG: VOC family protein [Paludibacter sp.]|nr:VOC family protein [Paludibacter sp.]
MLSNFSFHHVGYATKSIEKTSKVFQELGYTISDTSFDTLQHVKIALLKKKDSPQIELVEMIDETSPVSKILEKNGVTTYHVCYEVQDIELAIAELRKQKFVLLFNPVVAVALDNRLICYLFHKDVGLIELLQK